ncbi:MAG: LemA family protein [Flavobacteriales bacterium]|nr:LemA family protein [Flavobacteriales bacterium]
MPKFKLAAILGAIFFPIIIVVVYATTTVQTTYNDMVVKNETVTSSWSQVENVYQRRADLIPNLVSTVKGYAEHEKSTLTEVISARAKATSINIDANNLNAASIQQFQKAQAGLSSALSKLMMVSERYPDLKANQNFLELQSQLEGTENRIAVERKRFNESVKSYNSYILVFPTNIIAGFFAMEKRVYFESDEGAEKAPEVKF